MNNDHHPLVSCIMPTFNRRKFVPLALHYFSRQDYPNKELIVIDDGTDAVVDLIPDNAEISYHRLGKKRSLGEKLNLACELAKGDIIVHWDDDDWYGPSRISCQVNWLQTKNAEVCGMNTLLYFNITTKAAYKYIYPPQQKAWLLGSTLCYTKSLWRQNRFASIDVGMDALFVWSAPRQQVRPLENNDIAVHMIHEQNVSSKNTAGSWWHTYPVEEIQRVLKDDWYTYSNGFSAPSNKEVSLSVNPRPETATSPPNRNVYACLVHEKEDCIIDLVRNLHFHDPDSTILLYNGGENKDLLSGQFSYEKFNCQICPDPVPVRHGYLHPFALKTMAFAMHLGDFDILTIVDSDQLAIRKGYSKYLSNYLKSQKNAGLLSNRPVKISVGDSDVWTASQAFKEYELWKPLLKQFPNGEDNFVHWSFWPSTVFTQDAIKGLLKLFEENTLLQEIMKQTKIWATEEIIFPTLVKLLGYDIALNPCCHDFIRYRQAVTLKELDAAGQSPDAFWVHPIERKYDNELRKAIREKANHYILPNGTMKEPPTSVLLTIFPLLDRIKNIEGWLSDKEADLLLATAIKACHVLPPPHHIVEVGSYQGKSTVVLGSVAKALFPDAKVYAIDPHEGVVGATDQGLQKVPPTLNNFKKNIEGAGLSDVVVLLKDYSYRVDWQDPISFLFIDGLHDYPNVARDFWKFSSFLITGSYVAFHDYAYYYPGVQALVDEILGSGEYEKVQLAESLMVIKKR
jgi:hypothetical protein